MTEIILFLILFSISTFVAKKDLKVYPQIQKTNKYLTIISLISILIASIFTNTAKMDSITITIILSLMPILISHFMIDFDSTDLPDLSTLVIAICGFINLGILLFLGTIDSKKLIAYLLSGIVMFCGYFILAILSPLGGGDIKLIGAMALFFPIKTILPLVVLPFFAGSILSIGVLLKYYLIDKKKDENIEKPKTIPFGPAIIISFILMIII